MTTSTRKTNEKTAAEKNFMIIDFLDIDPSKIKFQELKALSNGSKIIPMRYKDGNTDKSLYVKYGARTCPFGISTSSDKKDEYRGKYLNDEKITGYSTSVSFNKDYEKDPYYAKAQEIDDFFINECIKNSVAWGLGGSKTRPIERTAIEGYDEKGLNGKWKRLIKYSYKVNKSTGEREYLDYAPRMEFGLPTASMSEQKGDNGMMRQEAVLKPTFYAADGEALPTATTENMNDILPKWSKISVLAAWGGMSIGTYGASMKPKVQQGRVYPNERLATDACLLNDDDDEDDEDDIGSSLGNVMGGVKPVKAFQPVEPKKLSMEEPPVAKIEEPKKMSMEEDSSSGDGGEEMDEIEEEEPEPEPVKPVRSTKVITTKKK